MPTTPAHRGAAFWPRLLGSVTAVLAGAVCFAPDLLGVGEVTGPVQVTAMRMPASMALMCVGLTAVVLALVVMRKLRRPAVRQFVFAGGAVLVVLGLVAGVQHAANGFTSHALATQAPRGAQTLTVVSANVLITNDDYSSVAAVIRTEHPQVIALAEARRDLVEAMLRDAKVAGHYQITASAPTYVGSERVHDDSLVLVADELEPQPREEALPLAAAGVHTRIGNLYAIHTAAPVQRSLVQSRWASTVREAVGLCREGTLVVGDFNATLRHSPVQLPATCVDAAASLGMSSAGTWPSSLPGWMGAQIDHQLYDRASLTPLSGEVFSVAGSDHRGLVMKYAVTGGGASS